MPKHLIVAAFMVEAATPDAATAKVTNALVGTAVPKSGAVVSITPTEWTNPRLRADLAKFSVEDVMEHLEP